MGLFQAQDGLFQFQLDLLCVHKSFQSQMPYLESVPNFQKCLIDVKLIKKEPIQPCFCFLLFFQSVL